MKTMTRFWILQVIGIGIIVACYLFGWLQFLIVNDPTYITLGIFGLTVFGVAMQAQGYPYVSHYLIQALPRYGIFGTVIGLMIVISGSAGDFNTIWKGLGVAFCTTVAGLIGSEWLRLTRESCSE